MRAARLAPLLLLLVLAPRSGWAQATETPSEEEAWNAFPERTPAPAPDDSAPFEPIDFPGQTAATDTAEEVLAPGVQGTAPVRMDALDGASLPPVEDAAPAREVPSAGPGDSARMGPAAPLVNSTREESSAPLSDAMRAEPATPLINSTREEPVAPLVNSTREEPAAPLVNSTREASSVPLSDATRAEPSAPQEDFSREASSALSLLPTPSAAGPSQRLTPEPLAVPLVRSLLDLAGATALTLSSAVAMDALVGTHCFRDTDRMCILTSFLVTMLSVSGTAPVGAWAVGSLLGGEGKLWAAYLGAAMGMGLGVVGTMPTIAFGSGVVLAVAGPIGAAVGAVIGYEVSHRRGVRGASRFAQRPVSLRVSPLVATTQGGSLLGGMMGTF